MRQNGARDLRFGAGIHNGLVGFHVGMMRYTATADEALALAADLIDAAEIIKESTGD